MKRGARTNQCSGCKVFFNSLYAFDKHRTGKHGIDRRCMTEDEMRAAGMSTNALGYWIGESMKGWQNEDNATEDESEVVDD